ncbi:uncharacterized protein [Choristoneura fumiferana]|uniref:uncharacterized protein n=1 Tax=Choristoneura fumiferana TaxID=7141 RepID=UPI003D1539FD
MGRATEQCNRLMRWCWLPVFYEQCIAANSVDLAPWLNELSAQNLADLVNMSDASYNWTQSQGSSLKYRHIDPKDILRQKPDIQQENYKIYDQMKDINPSFAQVPKACYTIQSTWRRARIDLLRYFSLREYYENTHTFEIGYLTHVIVSKYMNTLELYDMVAYRFLEHPMKNYAPTAWMWFIYINILDYTRHIIQWCHMMHEIMAKYGLASGTSKDGPDYETLSTPDPEEMEIDINMRRVFTRTT